MPGRVRLTVDDVEIIIGNLERNGQDASELKAVLNSVHHKVNGKVEGDLNLDGVIDEDEYVMILMKKSPVEEGGGLICPLCNKPTPKLYSGVCEGCFRPWALSTKRS